MKIKVLAFGIARDIMNATIVEAMIDGEATVAALKKQLETTYPKLHDLSSYMVAVNNEYALPDVILQPGDEVAIIPPVSGG